MLLSHWNSYAPLPYMYQAKKHIQYVASLRLHLIRYDIIFISSSKKRVNEKLFKLLRSRHMNKFHRSPKDTVLAM